MLPDSCVLIGIIDPTGTLAENEIFVQVRKDSFNLLHRERDGAMNEQDIANQTDKEEIIQD